MKSRRFLFLCIGVGCGFAALGASAAEMGTAFSYQGRLEDGGGPVTNTSPGCDFAFELWDALAGGTQINDTQAAIGVRVVNGVFTVVLDFGSGAFIGEARFLDINVCCPSGWYIGAA